MKIKITRSDGTTIEAEGTPEECGALLGSSGLAPVQTQPVVYPWVMPITVPVYPVYPPNPWYPSYPWYVEPAPSTPWYTITTCESALIPGTGVGCFSPGENSHTC